MFYTLCIYIKAGTEGDIDSDSDSSNSSGIYEHVDHEEGEQPVSESDSLDQEFPPELPPARQQNNKKNKADKSKGLKGKFKKFYNKSGTAGKSSGSNIAPSGQSSGIMSTIGDKLKKNLKKTKSSSGTSLELLNKEDNPVCESEGTDTDIDPEQLRPNQGTPPPLPPRQSGLYRASSGGELTKSNNTIEAPSRLNSNETEYLNNRLSSSSLESKTDPPLPPRNRISHNLDLNVVVPVKPGGGIGYVIFIYLPVLLKQVSCNGKTGLDPFFFFW